VSTPDHPDPPPTDTKRGGISWLIWTILTFPILYVLSIGPVARYYGKADPPAALEAFYTPLLWLTAKSPPLEHFLHWYLERLWLVQPAPTRSSASNAPPTTN
jgi:hypothetical protein